MGCDTKGYIITEYKDIHGIAECLQDSITKIVGQDPKFTRPMRPNCCVSPTYQPNGQFLVFNFWDGGDARTLFVHLGCDCDAQKLGDRKIILNLGCWGNSVKLISQFMNDLGKISWSTAMYIHANDCDGEPIEFQPTPTINTDHASLLSNMQTMHVIYPDDETEYVGTYMSIREAEDARDAFIKSEEYGGGFDETNFKIQPTY